MEDVFVIMDDMSPIGYITSQIEAYEYIAEYIVNYCNRSRHGEEELMKNLKELRRSYNKFCEGEQDGFGIEILEISAIRIEEIRG